jgi:DNA-binding PadR family transcriptional regulator
MDLNNETETNLPLTEVTYFILLSLAPGPKHGYAIMKDVRFMSKGRVSLSTGTLYGALPRLLEQGWISRVEAPAGKRPGRQRKLYQLTPVGQQLLEAEVSRLDSLLAAAQKRIANQST